ncbi:MAG: c-type cytochrome [Bacteroidota bacterium]
MVKEILAIGIFLTFIGCNTRNLNPFDEGPSPARSPDEELATFQLESGVKIQLVASEPMVQEPVTITFDEDGRLWVVEMRNYMPNVDGEGEDKPEGRISVLEDTDGDGVMDVSTVYIDSLIMPRALAVVNGGALIAENNALWITEDLDGDLQADTKILLDSTYAANGLPEHSDNGLWRGVDNWYYNAKSHFRYKLIDGQWQRDSTEFRGQWGLSHDDKGRLHYNYNWSQLHADLVPPNYLARNVNHTPTSGIDEGLTIDRRVYPIRDNPAVNRGYIPGTLTQDGKLLEFTAACSPLVYRGAVLAEFKGDVFVCEPAGNLIKRNIVEEMGLQLQASDPHPGREFLASTDERFRPVHTATGPDGALYIADMYRGIIEHGAYITPYLKEQIIQRKLSQPVRMGRIWRIVPESEQLPKPVKLSTLLSNELVTYLSYENGWYRDMAQRLLVERQDASVVPALTELAKTGNTELGRFHALWTLEGLNSENPDVLLGLINDESTLIASTALRLLEPQAAENTEVRAQLQAALLNRDEDSPIDLTLQQALTAQVLEPSATNQVLSEIIVQFDTSAMIRDAVLSSLQDREFAFMQHLRQQPDWQQSSPARAILLETLTAAIVNKGDSGELLALLSDLNNDQDFGWQQKAIASGLVVKGTQEKNQPVSLDRPPVLLTQNHSEITPVQQKAIASLFAWPGHTPRSKDSAKQNRLGEEGQKQFALGRQHYLTTCAGCHGTDGEGVNRFAPPLVASDWVLGDEKRLALLLLHGLEGPIRVNGKTYDAPEILPVMPAHSTMDDTELASIMTYIRNAWGNQAEPVPRGLVGKTRHTSQGRVVPWTAEELNQHIDDLQASVGK